MRQIRRSVFETNSSSTHSLTMLSEEDFTKWKNEKLYLAGDEVITREEAINELKKKEYFKDFDFSDEESLEEELNDWGYQTYNYYNDNYENEYETFEQSYTTKNGEKIIAFGYYGMN